ncbi:MAG: membrane protein insertase YidC [Bacteroidetes bacterium]|nr:MAG: membrane protein insertase YidC [Bacteroidota bacterium]
MNKNSIIGFVLIAAIMIGYSVWLSPSKEEIQQKQHFKDSLEYVQFQQDSIRKSQIVKTKQHTEKALESRKPEAGTSTVSEGKAPSSTYQAMHSKYDVFANSATGKNEKYYLENDLVKIEIDSKGGFIKQVQLKEYQTWDSLPLLLFDPSSMNFGLSFFSHDKAINTNDFYFRPADTTTTSLMVSDADSTTFSMRLYVDKADGVIDSTKYIEYVYTLHGDNYMFDFDINLINMHGVIPSNISSLPLVWETDLMKQERHIDRFNGATIYYKPVKDAVDYLSESGDDDEKISTKLKWVSFKQPFFSSTIIALNDFESGNLSVTENEHHTNPRYLKSVKAELDLPISFGNVSNIPFRFYFGPNKFYTLKSYGLDLERQIPIGWGFFLLAWINEYIVIPVFTFLGGMGWNYGIVILVLTLLLKLFLFPIAYKTYMSSAKMRVLKPEIDEIGAKFPDKKDAMKKQQAVMALYKKAGVNPAAGCVPMLLQMPILFAMFRFFPASIELRQQSFLWAKDLSSYDSILDLPFKIPAYGDHVSLFTLLMTISTLIYTKMNNQMMGQQQQSMPGMKTMMYLMPIMFLGIFNNYASGLSYYYFLANVITFLQMYAFRVMVNEDKLRAKIEINKKKPPKKKSAFTKRLEEAAKQRSKYKK